MEDCFHNIRLVPERWPRKPWETKADGLGSYGRNRHIICVWFMHTTLSMYMCIYMFICDVYFMYVYYVCTSCMFVDLLVSIIISLHLSIWILEVDGEILGRDCKEINLPCISFTKPFRIQKLKNNCDLLTFPCFPRMSWSSMCRNWALQRLRGVSCRGWPLALQRWANFKWLDSQIASTEHRFTSKFACVQMWFLLQNFHYETVS